MGVRLHEMLRGVAEPSPTCAACFTYHSLKCLHVSFPPAEQASVIFYLKCTFWPSRNVAALLWFKSTFCMPAFN
jgi:hypothetical protein